MVDDSGPWQTYPADYREQEMAMVARWIAAGDSGAVVGLVGCGRSHLLGFLCHRLDALRNYLPPHIGRVALIPVDIYNLANNDLSCLYRTVLHAFYWRQAQFSAETASFVADLYLTNRETQDPFLPQMALYELLRHLQRENFQVVLVLNRFDRFCETSTPQMMNTLRGLRDSFRNTLTYVVGMLTDVAHLPDPESLGDMYELLVGHTCWVGAMSAADAQRLLARLLHTAAHKPTAAQSERLLRLSGHFPSLLRAIGHWWIMQPTPPTNPAAWRSALFHDENVLFRLQRMWEGLSQEEQLALAELNGREQTSPSLTSQVAQQKERVLQQLSAKGLCRPADGDTPWQISSELLADYITTAASSVRGGIWLDTTAKVIFQGQQPLHELTPLQFEILRFLIKNPRVKHTRDDIIDNAWPEDEQREGITPNALQVHIANIRKKIEPNSAKPRYLTTWNGRPGGYQFFPEGKPI